MAEDSKTREVYRVAAPLVRFKTLTPDGVQVRDFYTGAIVPEDADQDAVRHHIRTKQIVREEVPAGAAQGAYKPQDGDDDAPDPLKANAFQAPQVHDVGGEAAQDIGSVRAEVRGRLVQERAEEERKAEAEKVEKELRAEGYGAKGRRRSSSAPASSSSSASAGEPPSTAKPPVAGSGAQTGGSASSGTAK